MIYYFFSSIAEYNSFAISPFNVTLMSARAVVHLLRDYEDLHLTTG